MLIALIAGTTYGQNQTPVNPQFTGDDPVNRDKNYGSLPDISALMRQVEANQKTSETVEKDYIYRSVQTERELDGHGGLKKTTTREFDIYWVQGVPVQRMTKKDSKPLSASEDKKENERIEKEVAKAKERRERAEAKGKPTAPNGEEEVTVSRMMELGSFTNARRVQLNGRDTIAVDFAGDPQAKTKSEFEKVIRDMVGTAWVDENDKVLVKVEGHFLNTFRIGGGLVADIQKGTSFSMEQKKVNDEVWLPSLIEGQGKARALLFFGFNGSVTAVESDYRKFRTTSTILPGVSTVEQDNAPPK